MRKAIINKLVSRYTLIEALMALVILWIAAAGVVFRAPMYADLSGETVCEYVYMPQQQSVGTPFR